MDKPKCFGKYPPGGNPGRVCRACPFAQECKRVEPKVIKVATKAKKEVKADESGHTGHSKSAQSKSTKPQSK